MSPRSTRTPLAPDYDAYDGYNNNAYSSRNLSYIPATTHYSSHNNPSSIPDSNQVDIHNPSYWSAYGNPTQRGSQRLGWAADPTTASQGSAQPYHYNASYQSVPTTEITQTSAPYYAYDSSHENYANYPYTSAVTQSAEYSSGSAPRMDPNRPSQGVPATNAAILQPSSHLSAHPMPYVDPHFRSSRSIPSAAISPQEGSSSHKTSSRTHARVPSPQVLPREWYQPSAQPDSSSSYYSQPAAQDLGPSTSAKTHDKQQHKPRKPSRNSKLDGIPKDQMQRFRVADFGPGPSSSGTKRTRLPGSDALPPARKGKNKAALSVEEKEVAAKRKKEANRVQAYRDQLDDVYAELRALLYPDEENSKLAPPNHGKIQCIRDALERLKSSDSIWQQKEARLEAEIRRLKTLVTRYQEKEHEWDAERSGYRQEIGATNELVGYLQRCLETKHNQT